MHDGCSHKRAPEVLPVAHSLHTGRRKVVGAPGFEPGTSCAQGRRILPFELIISQAFTRSAVRMCSGQSQEAITWLERAVDEHDGILPFLNFWYGFDPLRSDPRFQALLRRMNFPQQAPPGV